MSSLRWRLSLAFALLAALVAIAIGVVVYQLSANDQLARSRARAVASVRAAARYYELTRPIVPYPALRSSDPSIPAALRTAVGSGHLATYRGSWQGRPMIWAGRPAPDGHTAIFVRSSYATEQQALNDLRTKLIGAALAATVGGALIGLVLAGRLSLRLRRAAATAELVASGDLDARIGATGRDEVAALGSAVDRMAETLQQRIEYEQHFVADVAHDLRTPLTGLVTASSLLDDGQVASAVKERVGRLHLLVEDLLEIARLESGAATADLRWVEVDALVRRVAAGRDVTVVAGEPCRALVDPRRLERVLENLLDNAGQHGRPPVSVEVAPGRVVVSDHGPGFAAEVLARATERFATGGSQRGGGLGLGLAIAAGQARVLGGRLELANAPGGGAVVTIVLPAAS